MKKNVQKPASAATPSFAFSASEIGQKLLLLHREGPATQQRIAEHLLRNPVRAAAAGIEELAAAAGTSTATLSRFARGLGFAGYAELRAAVAGAVEEVMQPVEKLRGSLARSGPEGALQAEALEASLSNARAAADGLAGGLLGAAVERIDAARCVYVMGFGLSSHVAGILTLGLQPFRENVVGVVDYGGTEVAAARLAGVGEGDVLVAISLPRYARDAVDLTAFARSRRATVIAVTDAPTSPLAPLADVLLAAPVAHPVLPTATGAAVLVVEALVAAAMVSNPDNVRRAEDLADVLSAYLTTGVRG